MTWRALCRLPASPRLSIFRTHLFSAFADRSMSSPPQVVTVADPFEEQAQDYQKFRPTYPSSIYEYIEAAQSRHLGPLSHSASQARRSLAVDVATGSGQFAIPLTKVYEKVVGVDRSLAQLKHSPNLSNYTTMEGDAHHLPIADHTADLVCAAQAAHWFNIELYFKESHRCLRPSGCLAIVGYTQCSSPVDDVNHVLRHGFWNVLDSYWGECNRKRVDCQFQDVTWPASLFDSVSRFSDPVTVEMSATSLLRYLATCSAYLNYRRTHGNGSSYVDPVESVKAVLGSRPSIAVTFEYFVVVARSI